MFGSKSPTALAVLALLTGLCLLGLACNGAVRLGMAAAVRFLVPAVALGVDGLVDFSRQTPAVAMTYAVLPGAGCAPRIRCVPFLTPLRGR